MSTTAPPVCYNEPATPFAGQSCSFVRRGLPRRPSGGGFTMPPKAVPFWNNVHKTDTCWEWIAARTTDGYGVVHSPVLPRTRRAHRVSWERAHGPIPDGMFVLHTCDNPPCVRPDHLFLGTALDNALDCKVKRRNRTGERHGRAKLTWPLVDEIRASTEAAYSIARRLGVDKSVVLDARKGVTWQR